MTASPAEIADVLDKAAKHIERVGWTQRQLFDDSVPGRPPEECPVDAVGALNVALSGTPEFVARAPGALQLMAHEVDVLLRRRIEYTALAFWNDAEGRTQAEVTELFRKAAEDLRGEAAAETRGA